MAEKPQLSAAQLRQAMEIAGVTPDDLYHLLNTRRIRIQDWLDGIDSPPFYLIWLLPVFAECPLAKHRALAHATAAMAAFRRGEPYDPFDAPMGVSVD